jgi:hypothetical protein
MCVSPRIELAELGEFIALNIAMGVGDTGQKDLRFGEILYGIWTL